MNTYKTPPSVDITHGAANELPLELLAAEFREFCLDHGIDDETIADAKIAPGLRRWLRDFEARIEAARVLVPLAAKALAAEYDTIEHEDAHNAFYDAVGPYMTNSQRRAWDTQSLKATPTEIIEEACRVLGIPMSVNQNG